MPQLILYLLLGIFFVLNALAKCLAKATQSSIRTYAMDYIRLWD